MDTPVHARGAVFTAIVEIETGSQRVRTAILATASKSPRIILIHDGVRVAGIDIAGHGFTETEIEARFPGAVETLKNARVG